MKESTRRLRTGIFLVGSILLLLAILFFIGGRNIFSSSNTFKAYTCFDESVQGLSRGSAVKFKGAQIGTVSDIRIIFSDKDQFVLVEMEIDKTSFAGSTKIQEKGLRRALKEEIDKEDGPKLSCRQEYVGITGLKFIDLDYHEDKNKKKDPGKFEGKPDTLYIPSVKSTLADMTTAVAHAIEKVNELDLKKMSEEATGALQDLKQVTANLKKTFDESQMNEIRETLQRVNRITANLEKTFDESQMNDLKETLHHVNKITADLEKTSGQLNRLIDETKLPESTESFRNAAGKVSEASDAVVNSRQELTNTLFKLNQTIDSLRMLIEYLESDPGSLIRGKNRRNEEN